MLPSPHQASAETASVGSESPVDIADYSSISARQGLSDSQKYDLAINDDDFQPGYKYIYPTRLEYGKQRRFQYDWLQRYKWLVYSKKENGGFCLPCMLFGQGQGGGDLGILVSRPMVNFTKAQSTTVSWYPCPVADPVYTARHNMLQWEVLQHPEKNQDLPTIILWKWKTCISSTDAHPQGCACLFTWCHGHLC